MIETDGASALDMSAATITMRAALASGRVTYTDSWIRDGLFYQLMAPIMGPVIVDLNGSDEEMWRKTHDPVGARRLNLTCSLFLRARVAFGRGSAGRATSSSGLVC